MVCWRCRRDLCSVHIGTPLSHAQNRPPFFVGQIGCNFSNGPLFCWAPMRSVFSGARLEGANVPGGFPRQFSQQHLGAQAPPPAPVRPPPLKYPASKLPSHSSVTECNVYTLSAHTPSLHGSRIQTAHLLDVLIGLLIHSLDLENAIDKKRKKRQEKDLVIQFFRTQAL